MIWDNGHSLLACALKKFSGSWWHTKDGEQFIKIIIVGQSITDNAFTLHIPIKVCMYLLLPPLPCPEHYCIAEADVAVRTFCTGSPFHEKNWKEILMKWNHNPLFNKKSPFFFLHIYDTLLEKNHVVIIARYYVPTYWMFLHSAAIVIHCQVLAQDLVLTPDPSSIQVELKAMIFNG